jgi:hypothetical protein
VFPSAERFEQWPNVSVGRKSWHIFTAKTIESPVLLLAVHCSSILCILFAALLLSPWVYPPVNLHQFDQDWP